MGLYVYCVSNFSFSLIVFNARSTIVSLLLFVFYFMFVVL